MTKFKSLKFLFAMLFLCSVTLGFASCSDDDDIDGPIIEPVEVRLLPTKITIEDEDYTIVYDFTYNNKNQLTKWVDEEGEEYLIEYDSAGKLVKYKDSYYEMQYAYSENKVLITTNYPQDNREITLNEKGFMTKVIYPNQTNREYTYTYDDEHNFLTRSFNGEVNQTVTYHNEYFSPFLYLDLPDFFMLYDDYWGIQTSGVHMIKSDFNADGVYEYKVVENNMGFPTKIEVNESSRKQTHTISIEYKEVISM